MPMYERGEFYAQTKQSLTFLSSVCGIVGQMDK